MDIFVGKQKRSGRKMTVMKLAPTVSTYAEPKPGPSCITVADFDMSMNSDTLLDKLCCVGKRNTHKELRNSVSMVFPK